MNIIRPRLSTGGFALPAVGAILTVVVAYAAVHIGAKLSLAAVAVAAIFLLSTFAYLRVPHLAIAVTIPLFALIPALRVFVSPVVGGLKDVIDLAAISAMVILVLFERRRPDPWVSGTVMLLLALYVINPGHGHNSAWVQGVRLTGEPLLLLLVGFVLPDPRRTLRWALISLIATGCFVATYGLFQQLVGAGTLVSFGYSYSSQVRTIGHFLRSFGSFDDPFAYAAFILFALGAVFFWLRRGALAWAVAALLLLGLGVSFVRTGVLVMTGYIGLQLVRRRQIVPAAAFVAAAMIGASLTLLGSSGTQTTKVTLLVHGGSERVIAGVGAGQSLFLNGRVSAWTAALGSNPAGWVFGRGVGKTGTAAARGSVSLIPTTNGSNASQTQAVDSGYFATLADVGLVGLAVELVLFVRLGKLARLYARTGNDAGWFGLALLVCMLLDALTRASFTGFPTAFLGMLLLGLALAAAAEAPEAAPRTP